VHESATLEENSNVKRSLISAKCKLGKDTKVINSVIQKGATIGNG